MYPLHFSYIYFSNSFELVEIIINFWYYFFANTVPNISIKQTFKRHLGTLCLELNTIRGVSLKSLFNDITVRSADTYLSLNLCDFETLLKIQLLPFAVNEFEYFSYKKKWLLKRNDIMQLIKSINLSHLIWWYVSGTDLYITLLL